MERDKYTCPVCGHKAEKKNRIVTLCLECQKKGIPFPPIGNHYIPKTCRERGLKYKSCKDCPDFSEKPVEYLFDASLTVHHLDGNKRNQSLDNLVTVCVSCHRRLHPRGRILSIDDAKKSLLLDSKKANKKQK